MANNYVQFSEHWKFKTPEAAEMFDGIARACRLIAREDFDGNEAPDDLEDDDRAAVAAFMALPEDARAPLAESAADFGMFDFEIDSKAGPGVVWISSDEGGNLDMAAEIAQVVLETVGDTETVFTATSAATCSKLRLGEFGGGWVAVSAKEIRGGSTWGAAERAAKVMKRKIKSAK